MNHLRRTASVKLAEQDTSNQNKQPPANAHEFTETTPVGNWLAQYCSAKLVFLLLVCAAVPVLCSGQEDLRKTPSLLPESVARKSAITIVMPTYPKEALRLGVSGLVHVKFKTNPEGEVLQIKVKPGTHPLLSAAAANAVSRWRFKPRPGLDGFDKPFISRLIFRFDFNNGESQVELYSPTPDRRIDECLGCSNSAREMREWREWDEVLTDPVENSQRQDIP